MSDIQITINTGGIKTRLRVYIYVDHNNQNDNPGTLCLNIEEIKLQDTSKLDF